ncbi:MAG: hypothetical protein COB53_03100 [Elusimicrobia bacterium]|nr:MAG: hypothetical protein COB53_03100 [Elusimicrobiota bacterium]
MLRLLLLFLFLPVPGEAAAYPLRVSGQGLFGNRSYAKLFRTKVDGAIATIKGLDMPFDESVLSIDVQFTDGVIERSALNTDMRVVYSGGKLVEAGIAFVFPTSMSADEASALILHEVGHLPFEMLKREERVARGVPSFLPGYVELWCDALAVTEMGDKDIVARALSKWVAAMGGGGSGYDFRRFSVSRDAASWDMRDDHVRFTPVRFYVGRLMDGGDEVLSVLFAASIDSASWEVERMLAGDIAGVGAANVRLISALRSKAGL